MSSGSDSDSSSSQSPISVAITEHLKSQKKVKQKAADKSKTRTVVEEDPLEPFLTAARWIPLAIDPFVNLLDVFVVGIQGRSGPGRREAMNKDEQYKCIVFELIMLHVPKLMTVLSDCYKDPKIFDNFAKEMSKPPSNTRSNDANAFKTMLPTYLPPDDSKRALFIIPDVSNKHAWGWNNPITARFLCPMRLIPKFDKDPETFLEKVQSGARVIKASDYPMFLYDVDKYTPGNIYSGLFQGPLLLRFYRHVFTGPSSWQKGTSAGGKQARGVANNLKAPTPRTIAYVAIMTRWALSSATKFDINDQGFNLTDFYRNIITTFNERIDYDSDYKLDNATTTWIKDTLRWWQMNVPGLQRGSANAVGGEESDNSDEEESDLTKLLASRKTKADNFAIDPALIDSPSAPNSSSATSPPTMAPGAAPQDSVSQPPSPVPRTVTTPERPLSPSGPAPRTATTPEGPLSPPGPAPPTVPTPEGPVSQPPGPAPRTATTPEEPISPTGSTNKRPKERSTAADDGDESDLSPVPTSPAPKRTKKADSEAPKATTSKKLKPKPAPAPRAIRKSTRKKY